MTYAAKKEATPNTGVRGPATLGRQSTRGELGTFSGVPAARKQSRGEQNIGGGRRVGASRTV